VASASAGPAGAPVRLTIQPNQLAALAKTAENPAYLAIIGRTEPLSVGGTVKLVFHFDKQRDVRVTAPVAVPLSPLPRASMTLPTEEH
jgi:copper(I)-binding protein